MAKANTLYWFPVSGNALGAGLYIKEKQLKYDIQVVDLMKGEQMQDWFIALNPLHQIPTLTDANCEGVWESNAILNHLAKEKGESVSDLDNMAMQWRQTTVYSYFAQVYMGHLFGGNKDNIPKGVKGLQEVFEPLMKNFFLKDRKFIGGDLPSIADYSFVPLVTLMLGSPYWSVVDERIKRWVSDFTSTVKCWDELSKPQTGFVASKSGSSDNLIPTTMLAAVCTAYTGYQELDESALTVVDNAKVPECGPGEVLIKVVASSVNPIDWKIVSGALKAMMPLTFPLTIGFECAGKIVKIGSEVTRFSVGDDVWTDATRGCFAEYVCVNAIKVGLAPVNIPPAEAAVVPLAGLTSLQALRAIDAGPNNSKVLILGGSGGTGHLAVQIAKSLGCHVTTTCSGRNAEFVKSLGADVVIDYRTAQWWEECKGVDGVYDCAGEPKVFEHAQKVLKDAGKFVTIAGFGVDKFAWERGITGRFLLTDSSTPADLDSLKSMCEAGALKPKMHGSFPLSDIWGAFKESKSGRVVGKISITL